MLPTDAEAHVFANGNCNGFTCGNKPANILFRRDGTPLLSDFGIAKQIKLDAELTSTGTILGSPFYMSPEQSEGRVVDGRTETKTNGRVDLAIER